MVFYHLFYELKDNGLLNPDCDKDIFCLHTVFLPEIQSHLDSFAGWCHHHLRTQHNKTPLQKWIESMTKNHQRVFKLVDEADFRCAFYSKNISNPYYELTMMHENTEDILTAL